MNCREFLTRHSEYADGRLASEDAARLAAHGASCPSCARYDRVVRRGTDLVRDLLPRVGASDDLEHRIRHRLFHVRDEGSRRLAGTASVYAAAATVILIAAGAGLFLLSSGRVAEVDSQVVWASPPPAITPLRANAQAVASSSSLAPAYLAPAVATIEGEADARDAHVASPAGWPVYSRGAMAVAFPGSHTSLVVTPADFRHSSRQPAGALLLRH